MSRRTQRPRGLNAEETWRWHLDNTIVPWGACWLWTGPVNSSGYPVVWVEGRQKYAHRLAWEVTRGPIPEGDSVHHVCGGPAGLGKTCVRPGHLQLASRADNNLEMLSRRALVAARDGHFDRLVEHQARIAQLEAALAELDPDHPLLAA